MQVVVIDYGMGNIASVVNMVRKVGGEARISGKVDEILKATHLILPGVGAFDHGVRQLRALGLFSVINDMTSKGTPLLGICLGMQLLAKRSEEGELDGLGLINAEFKRFSFREYPAFRIPHVGWNHVKIVKRNPLMANDGNEQRFYFTHSYHALCTHKEDILTTTEYGYSFTSSYSRDNIYGVQFHPEKSHRFGMALIKNFLGV